MAVTHGTLVVVAEPVREVLHVATVATSLTPAEPGVKGIGVHAIVSKRVFANVEEADHASREGLSARRVSAGHLGGGGGWSWRPDWFPQLGRSRLCAVVSEQGRVAVAALEHDRRLGCHGRWRGGREGTRAP